MLPSIILCTLIVGCFGSAEELEPLIPDSQIVGGTEVNINQYPHQLSLQTTGHICGASIISNKWAVTAGHCVGLPANKYTLRAGNNDKNLGVPYKIKKIIRHPNYNSKTVDYDVALLEIDGIISFNSNIKAVRLTNVEPSTGMMTDVTGWGALKEGGTASPRLMKVSLPVVSRSKCQNIYNPLKMVITDRMICAGYSQGGKDSCQGDSGGPMTSNGVLYGIVSWGYGCAHPSYPGVYSNVAKLRPWIKSIIPIIVPVTRCSLTIDVQMSTKIFILFFFILLKDAFAFDNMRYVNITENPYHVSIEKYGRHICSGALVHESWAITAASCVFRTDPSTITVRVRSSTLDTGGNQLQVGIIVVQEDFAKFVLANNIALIKLKTPVQFGERLLPIGIPAKKDYVPDVGTRCSVTGWKHTMAGPVEPQLTVIGVPLVNQTICKSVVPCYEPVLQKMLCAGDMIYGVETCQSDPGAPLIEDQTLIGILSYGLGCKTMKHPGIYTRVSSYLEWISANSGIRYT
ncbi:Transmembrane protease serine 9 [Anthophora retusa]